MVIVGQISRKPGVLSHISSMTSDIFRPVRLLQVPYFLIRQLDMHRFCYDDINKKNGVSRTNQDILIESFNFSKELVPTIGAVTARMHAQLSRFPRIE